MKYKLVFFIFITALMLFLISGCRKENGTVMVIPSASISLLTEKPITIGDPIDIALTIYHNKNEVTFPDENESFLPFTLRNISTRQKRIKGKSYKTTIFYTITIFQTGNYKLRPFKITAGDLTLKTEALNISILSVLPKNGAGPQLKDIAPPYAARIKPVTVSIILLCLLGAAALFYFLLRIFKRKKVKTHKQVLTRPVIDPFQYSLCELADLKNAHEGNQLDSKQTYSKISYIFRYFLGIILRINAPQMTTRELGRHIRRSTGTRIPASRLMNILKTSDMVKFARGKPQKNRVKEDIEESIHIIKEVRDSMPEKDEILQ